MVKLPSEISIGVGSIFNTWSEKNDIAGPNKGTVEKAIGIFEILSSHANHMALFFQITC